MQNYKKYQRGYFLPPVPSNEWVKKDYIEKAPICAAWTCGTATRH